MQDLPTSYQPKEKEKKWYDYWEKNNLFSPSEDKSKPTFSIVLPPPNVTGMLHMGHALANTLQDVIVRFKRMQGYRALWVPGTDHAGIATQTVVEKKLFAKTGKKRRDFSKEEFLQHVWAEKESNESNIINQLKRLGCSLDWSAYRFTMDEKSNQAVRKVFKKLYDEGLIYQGDYLVNWDPVTQTALSDDEVEYEEVESSLWYIKYPLENDYITVATTRPETLFGDVAIAVHPEDSRFVALIGKEASLPLTDRKIPIIQDPMVDPEFGSGAVKITPAHDPNDYEMGLKHDLPMVNLLEKDGTLNDLCGSFAGEHIESAREKVVKALTQQNLIERIDDYTLRRGISYRSKAVIQPFLSKQWFIRMEPFKQSLIEAVREKKVELLPSHWENTYMHWIENLRDWCISRQLWWGHQIPIWYNRNDPEKHICYDGEGLPPEVEKDPSSWTRDEDVLDTWFSSALWPFSTLGWPENTEKLKEFYPNSLLITGHDILFFWVARMIMMGQYVMKDIPFHQSFVHGLIYGKSYFRFSEGEVHYVPPDEKKRYDLGSSLLHGVYAKWEKMSKSKGNVIDPIEIIEDYGTDALRMALISSVTFARQIDLDRRRFEEHKNFANKIYNGARFVLMHLSNLQEDDWANGIEIDSLEDRWILAKLQSLISLFRDALEHFAFDKACHLIYDFYWNQFCAYYLELSKHILFGNNEKEKKNRQKILAIILTETMLLLHPLAPFITEEIFSLIRSLFATFSFKAKCPYTSKWQQSINAECCIIAPFPDAIYPEDNKAVDEFEYVDSILHAARNIRGEMGLAPSEKIRLEIIADPKDPFRELIEKNKHILLALLPLQELIFTENEPEGFGASQIIEKVKLFVALTPEMRAREEKRLLKEQEKLLKKETKLNSQLSNQEFLANAPKELVARFQKDLSQVKEQLSLIESKLQKFNIS